LLKQSYFSYPQFVNGGNSRFSQIFSGFTQIYLSRSARIPARKQPELQAMAGGRS